MLRRLTRLQRLVILSLSGPILALNIWLLSLVFHFFQHLITVLMVAAILAFLLNYAIHLLERNHMRRNHAVTVTLLLTLIILVTIGSTLIPVLIDQTIQLLNRLPEGLQAAQRSLVGFDQWATTHNLPLNLESLGGQINTQIENQLQSLATQTVQFALNTVSILLDGILVLVLTFYMLLYGQPLWQGLIHLLPTQVAHPFNAALQKNLHNFFVSQLLLGLFMVSTLTPLFLFLKIPFPLLSALIIGAGELVPFIGATIGIGLVTIVVLFQSVGLAFKAAIAAVIMQQIKDNVLAPRVMGDFTGLNPIWIFVALLTGFQIAGLLGVVIAVPLMATVKDTVEAMRKAYLFRKVQAESSLSH